MREVETTRMDKRSARRVLDVLIVSWASGGNLPPLLAAGTLLAARDQHVCVLASSATRQLAVDAGFDVVGYRRGPDPKWTLRSRSRRPR